MRPLSILLATVSSVALSVAAASALSSPLSVDRAQAVTLSLANAVVAAVVNVSESVPPEATAEQIDAASQAISLLVPDCQDAVRLIDATGMALDASNQPSGVLEMRALEELLEGAPRAQAVVGTQLRTFLPLTNDMHPNCMTCHAGYSAMAPGTVVGAASFRVDL